MSRTLLFMYPSDNYDDGAGQYKLTKQGQEDVKDLALQTIGTQFEINKVFYGTSSPQKEAAEILAKEYSGAQKPLPIQKSAALGISNSDVLSLLEELPNNGTFLLISGFSNVERAIFRLTGQAIHHHPSDAVVISDNAPKMPVQISHYRLHHLKAS